MKHENETTKSTPNVKLVKDNLGRNWLCDASVASDSDPRNQSCVLSDDIIYDRNFGG